MDYKVHMQKSFEGDLNKSAEISYHMVKNVYKGLFELDTVYCVILLSLKLK